MFELGDFTVADPEHAFVFRVGRRGRLAADVEELVLDLAQRGVEPLVLLAAGAARFHALGVEDAHEADDGVQLVHGAVGHDARRVLGHALAADQAGLAAVAEPRVHARDADGH